MKIMKIQKLLLSYFKSKVLDCKGIKFLNIEDIVSYTWLSTPDTDHSSPFNFLLYILTEYWWGLQIKGADTV